MTCFICSRVSETIYYNEHYDNIISFKDLSWTYKIDQRTEGASALINISPAHLNPIHFKNWLALQIFNRAVSATMLTRITAGQLNSGSARSTWNFILEIDPFFGMLSSRTLYNRSPYHSAKVAKSAKELEIFSASEKWFNWKHQSSSCFDRSILFFLFYWRNRSKKKFDLYKQRV